MKLESCRVNGALRQLALELEATAGDEIELWGWAFDADTGGGIPDLAVRIDKRTTIPAQTRIPREDLAPVVGAGGIDCGFVVRLATGDLAPGDHRLFFVITASSGVEWATYDLVLRLAEPPNAPERRHQIALATAMKSGGQHVSSVLFSYFGFENPPFGELTDAEHVLTDAVLEPALAHPFIFGGHMIARAITISLIAHWGLKAVQTWRNLGDVVVSLDDHTLTAPEHSWRNTYAFIENRSAYAAMPEQRRYRYQIRNAIPWYLNFYTTWRAARAPLFMRYEWMASDPQSYFRYLVAHLARTVDADALERIVAHGPTARSNFNVGVVGRSASALDDESKQMLEACIREHPSDIDELLLELPWYRDRAHHVTVCKTSDGQAFVIADGVRRKATEHWLITHQCDMQALSNVAPSDLSDIPRAGDLF